MLPRIFAFSSAYNVPLDISFLFSVSARINGGCDDGKGYSNTVGAFERASRISPISPRNNIIPPLARHSTSKPQPPTPHPTATNIPSSKRPNVEGRPMIQEIYVDASNTGIGVVLGSKWLAWTFNGLSPLIPRNMTSKQINTTWAELLAVELGVRTLVAEGARDTAVCVHSDNTSVVDALGRGSWAKKVELNDVINRIGALGTAHILDIEVKRVPGCENPADGPSKGRYPPFEKLLENAPDLPVHLQEVVSLVTK